MEKLSTCTGPGPNRPLRPVRKNMGHTATPLPGGFWSGKRMRRSVSTTPGSTPGMPCLPSGPIFCPLSSESSPGTSPWTDGAGPGRPSEAEAGWKWPSTSWRTVCPTAIARTEALEAGETAAIISAFLRGQEERDRKLFIRRYFHLESLEELRAEFSMTEGQVKSRLHRMRKKLKAELEREGVAV